jgi:hypothetical protein
MQLTFLDTERFNGRLPYEEKWVGLGAAHLSLRFVSVEEEQFEKSSRNFILVSTSRPENIPLHPFE